MFTLRAFTPTPADRLAFRDLNRAWIQRYFTLEDHDNEMLDAPEAYILAPGGYIVMAESAGQLVGTGALLQDGPDAYELAKMAVRDDHQGQGIGRAVAEAALAEARRRGARRIWLESNRRLAPALALYQTLGFVEVPLHATPYARADIRMELLLR